MTEGLLGGILGGEDENSEVEATETLASADAFAAAVVARLSASDPEVARDTAAFLQEQTQLLKVQKDHLKDEHALRLDRLSGQAREGKLARGVTGKVVADGLLDQLRKLQSATRADAAKRA